MTITTTNGEKFTKAQHAEMANMLYVRFGRDITQATAAWRRMLQNGTTEQEFRQLLLEVPDTPALDLLEELLAITEQHTILLDFNDYDKWQRISSKCADLRDGSN